MQTPSTCEEKRGDLFGGFAFLVGGRSVVGRRVDDGDRHGAGKHHVLGQRRELRDQRLSSREQRHLLLLPLLLLLRLLILLLRNETPRPKSFHRDEC